MMLAIATSETSAENGNRPQPNSLEKVFNSSESGYESLRQFIKPYNNISMYHVVSVHLSAQAASLTQHKLVVQETGTFGQDGNEISI